MYGRDHHDTPGASAGGLAPVPLSHTSPTLALESAQQPEPRLRHCVSSNSDPHKVRLIAYQQQQPTSTSASLTRSSNSDTVGTFSTSDNDTDPFPDEPYEYTATWTTVSDTQTSSSGWTSDMPEDRSETEPEPEPAELRTTYHFPGAQYDTERTVVRPNPRFVGLSAAQLYTHRPQSAVSLVSNATVISPSQSTVSLPSAAESESGSGTGSDADCDADASPGPAQAAMRGVGYVSKWLNFEEDVAYREHEWLLEQAGCGRVEIWVTEECVVEDVSRPRVFFPPASPGQSRVSGQR